MARHSAAITGTSYSRSPAATAPPRLRQPAHAPYDTRELCAVSPEDPGLPPVEQFVRLVESSNVQAVTLMPALVYLNWLRSGGPRLAGSGAPLTAASLRALSWPPSTSTTSRQITSTGQDTPMSILARATIYTSDVNLMEKKLLRLLDWDLRFTEPVWVDHLAPVQSRLKSKNRGQYNRSRIARYHRALNCVPKQ